MIKFLCNIKSLMILNDCYFYFVYVFGLNGFKLLLKKDIYFFFYFLIILLIFFYLIINRNNVVNKLFYVIFMYLFK